MSKIESIRGKIRQIIPGKSSPDQEPFHLTKSQAIILATGVEFHAEGISWWSGKIMIDTLQERKLISGINHSKVYVDLKKLYGAGMLDARNLYLGKENLPRGRLMIRFVREYHVSEEGRRERSKVDIREDSKQSSSYHAPVPENT